ncbi:hypothetical protein L3X38_032977 [Prunus dulcis]|uniref:Reverse transcriptase Ty1/copia-type domain-containing protein n=1 Tax=Prunus dulcis TaxID=3755 RepID=A0AAD4YWJ6_PRUDU|nr:hypothetical protein L3X38_032977 [Prunus dulcis]
MGDNSIVGAVAAASSNLCVSNSIPGTGSNTWIIDTSASDHMTYDAKFVDELSSNTRNPYITSANRLPYPITGEGTISVTPTLSLSSAYCSEASDRSPISEDETCGAYEEMTNPPLELDQLPISGDEAGAVGVETTVHTEASDHSPVLENNESDSCIDEFNAITPSALPVPQSTHDSESSEDALSNLKWMDAMNVEMDALNRSKTWDLVPLPRGKKVVGCRWVFTLKHKADGSIDGYKARLVAKGYT